MQDAKHRIKSLIISKPGAKPKEPHAHEGSNDSDEECEGTVGNTQNKANQVLTYML